MIVSDGMTWISSKDIKAVGQFSDGMFQIHVNGIGAITLRYSDTERAFAIRANLILGLEPVSGVMSDTIELLLEQGRHLGLDADKVLSTMKELQGAHV